ncbi:6590_t:CDS:2 [Cetraspora pellucida]|uniref:6590_t:CDS:1 n=1 Tax=Cetraspora pellucida TaxID=1433469 RepID=A0ACA9K2D9_9GLOM|nr:6590_t:CDS:2 [Cetraspora pellucida]
MASENDNIVVILVQRNVLVMVLVIVLVIVPVIVLVEPKISKKKGDRQWGNRNLKQADDFREDSINKPKE